MSYQPTDGFLRGGANILNTRNNTDGLLSPFGPLVTGGVADISRTGTVTTVASFATQEVLADTGIFTATTLASAIESLVDTGSFAGLVTVTGKETIALDVTLTSSASFVDTASIADTATAALAVVLTSQQSLAEASTAPTVSYFVGQDTLVDAAPGTDQGTVYSVVTLTSDQTITDNGSFTAVSYFTSVETIRDITPGADEGTVAALARFFASETLTADGALLSTAALSSSQAFRDLGSVTSIALITADTYVLDGATGKILRVFVVDGQIRLAEVDGFPPTNHKVLPSYVLMKDGVIDLGRAGNVLVGKAGSARPTKIVVPDEGRNGKLASGKNGTLS